jgi:hypothetical protein
MIKKLEEIWLHKKLKKDILKNLIQQI